MLAVYGTESDLAAQAAQLDGLLADCRSVFVAGQEHSVLVEVPDVLRGLALDWLREQGAELRGPGAEPRGPETLPRGPETLPRGPGQPGPGLKVADLRTAEPCATVLVGEVLPARAERSLR